MLRFFLVAALLAVSSPSDADSCTAPVPVCKLVVRNFDGPTKLADASRSAFMTGLDKYIVVAQKQWDAAFGRQQWREAADRTGAAAVIEGRIRRHTLTILVRDAVTGQEVDSVTVNVRDNGVAVDPVRLVRDVDDIFPWIECNPPHETGAPFLEFVGEGDN
jgi:hypothetical protein